MPYLEQRRQETHNKWPTNPVDPVTWRERERVSLLLRMRKERERERERERRERYIAYVRFCHETKVYEFDIRVLIQ